MSTVYTSVMLTSLQSICAITYPTSPQSYSDDIAENHGSHAINSLLKRIKTTSTVLVDEDIQDLQLVGRQATSRAIRTRRTIKCRKDIQELLSALRTSQPKVYGGVSSGIPSLHIRFLHNSKELASIAVKSPNLLDLDYPRGDIELGNGAEFTLWFKSRGIANSFFN